MRILTRFFGVLPNETRRTMMFFFYMFFLVAGFIIAKSARDGLFLTQNTPLNLPYIYIGIALLMGVTVAFYARISSRLSLPHTIAGVHAFVGLSFFLFWYVFGVVRNGFSFGAFYIWVSIFGAIHMSQFWLLASELHDSRSAKRLFGFIGSGGILGGIAGGFIARWIAESFGTETLLPLLGVLFFSCGILVYILHRMQHPSEKPVAVAQPEKSGLTSGLELFKRHKYLQWLVVILFVTELVSTFVDFQFKVIVSETFPHKNELTAFLGSFYGFLNIANFLFQAFLTARIIDSAGMKGAALILPATLLTGSIAVLFFPVLWAAIWIKVGDDGVRHSLNRSVMELLYLPVPSEIRERAKLFVDSAGVQAATALGGLALFFYIRAFQSDVAPLALIVFALCIAWLIVSLVAHKQYVNAFREGLKMRAIDVESLSLKIVDVATLETLIQALNSTDEKVVIYAIDLLQRGGKGYLVSPWLLHHSSSRVRLKVVEIISQRSDRSALGLLKGAIQDESVEVQAEALQTICLLEPEAQEQMVNSLAMEQDPKLRRAAILCAALGSEDQQKQAHHWLDQMIQTTGDDRTVMQLEAAKALAKLPVSFHDLFPPLFASTDVALVREAIRSAAMAANPDLIRLIAEKLGDRRLKAEARRALLKFDPEVIPILDAFLEDDTMPVWAKRHLPRTIGAFGTQSAADALFRRFDHPDRFIRDKILRALTQLRAVHREFAFHRPTVEQRIFQEAEEYFHHLALKEAVISSHGKGDGSFLIKSLEKRQDLHVDRIFRFLSLIYPHRDISNAASSLKSKESTFRNSAIDYLDNTLERSLRRIILPMIDTIPDPVKLTRVESYLPIRRRTIEEAILELLKGSDSWLSACAVYWIYQQGRSDLQPHMESLQNREDPLIHDTIGWVTQRAASDFMFSPEVS